MLLFYAMLLLPFEVQLFGVRVALPGWLKSVIGLSLPVMANVAEIVRGGVQSIPLGQWESAEALAFSRRQTLSRHRAASHKAHDPAVDEPLCHPDHGDKPDLDRRRAGRRSLTRAALVAEGRTQLFMPMYLMLLLMFFSYCYPIARLTATLERRFAVKG